MITFTECDLNRVQTPHSDTLVVTVHVGSHDVRHILVDQGNSAEVMFYSLFKRLDLPETTLQLSDVPLVGFNGSLVWPLGRIFLHITMGSVMLTVEFIVVNILSPYNILDCNWLHGLKAIASTYRQVVHYIGFDRRQEDLFGDQVEATKCYVSTIHNSSHAKQVGSKAEEKAVEDLVTVPTNEDGS